ncbi:MAG: aldo/keto reductase [Promethearchaeota archaeon]|jgi:aryl-alcohol dehydrogenase-like predicted oxidoreductase
MDKRVLGRTKHKSSLIALGGASLRPETRKESTEFIKYAFDHGINHVDIAPTYGSGEAENILGEWVKEYRSNIFLACKTNKRTKIEASEELHRSLKRMQTDYFDLYQLHGLDDLKDLEIVMSEEGAIRAILEAKEQGLLKYVGITSHNPENIMKALEKFDFDTVLLPINYILKAHPEPKTDYEPVLSLARKRNLGVIAMKSVAKGPWTCEERGYRCWYQPFDTEKEVDESLRFTLSQYVTTVASCSDIRIARMVIDAAERFTPMNEEEQNRLLKKATDYKPLFPRIK